MASIPCHLHEQETNRMLTRYALVTLVCNGSHFGSTHYMGLTVWDFVKQATQLAQSVAGSRIERVVLTSGLNRAALQQLSQNWIIVVVPPRVLREYRVRPVYNRDQAVSAHTRWPTSGVVQSRKDCACTSLRFFAWNLTQYARALVSDSDMCLYQDPLPWLRWQHSRGEHFIAMQELSRRGYNGINDGLAMIKPNFDVFRILVDLARTQSQTPYTNGVQDVTESVYGSRSDFPTLPSHLSIKWGTCKHPLAHPRAWYEERRIPALETSLFPSGRVRVPGSWEWPLIGLSDSAWAVARLWE